MASIIDDAEPIRMETHRRVPASAPGWTPIDVMRMALEALAARSLVWIATAAATALWTLAVLHPEVLRLIASTGFCVTVLVPILIRDTRGGER